MPDKSLDDWSLVTASLSRSTKTVMVLDLVESVRLMEENEADIVHRWQGVQRMVGKLLVQHGGRLVKSLGDGMMLEFDQPQTAARCALAVQAAMPGFNLGYGVEQHLMLRIGLHTAQVYADAMDIYGSGVNLAARITTLAGPGEVMISAKVKEALVAPAGPGEVVTSAEVRDALTDGLDGTLEDLGECYLKHVSGAVRVYRVGAAGPMPVLPSRDRYGVPLQPTIAVIPFEARSEEPGHIAVGDLIADAVIAQLSKVLDILVISRLSSAAFRGRTTSTNEVQARLGARYIVSGAYYVSGRSLVLMVELADASTQQVIWADRIIGTLDDLLSAQSEVIEAVVHATTHAVLQREVERTQTQPLPTLEGYALMLGGINLMHRSTKREFDRSREALATLIDRHRHVAAPRAWMGKWYVLKATRGMTDDLQREAHAALDHTKRALDADPSNSLALAMEGFVYCHLQKDVETALLRLNLACSTNPSEALAWLFSSVVHAFVGDTQQAIFASDRALALSPLDPLRHYFESLATAAALSAEDYLRAVALGEKSLRGNRTHLPTMRALVAAYWYLDQQEKAREMAKTLMLSSPAFTVSKYLQSSASAAYPFGKKLALALAQAGVPSR
ncbi:hypothetical protein RD110_06510 [Rhodoferax koreense]|uniref:Guanylate cyclase domain-containing protein n=1 Tax=Rhodoferax koreensis TaxID=1842727 RepID=A0A1P8JT24_9BURK|nr:adenylate/guanylate cyclase domain-containing protein [Rhodoferax koreense]APW36888.1 hypothetical protein RD110_06510 [Rhodoferax koreense]